MFSVGCSEEAIEIVKHNIEELNKRGIKTLITSCSGCWFNISHYYPIFAKKLNQKFNVRIEHETEFISKLVEEGKIKPKFPLNFKVTYHDPCHIGRGGRIFEPPRKILNSIPQLEFIEMPHNRENSLCCSRHLMRYPKLGLPVNSRRVMEAKNIGATAIVSACPTCETNFRTCIAENKLNMEVIDITDLIAESIGLPTIIFLKLSKLVGNSSPECLVDIFLTEEELKREQNLLSPHEESYKKLRGRLQNLKDLKPKAVMDNDAPKPPPSC
jgi:Fe-S oxidoreductase